MRLEKIEINNFRCFRHYALDFAPGVTVLIGRNGSGKTSLIHAIHKCLSFIFSNHSEYGENYLAAGNPSLKVNSFEPGDFHYDGADRLVSTDVSIKAKATLHNGRSIEWELYKKSGANSSLYHSLYKEAYQTFLDSAAGGEIVWHVLSYYSDSFPHKNVKLVKFASDAIGNGRMKRNFGYYQWDDESACTAIWETRLCNKLLQMVPYYTPAARIASNILEYETSHADEIDFNKNAEYRALVDEQKRIQDAFTPLYEETQFVENYLKKFVSFFPEIVSQKYAIDYLTAAQSDTGLQLNIIFKDGNSSFLQNLPAGYRRLFAIVLDLAYRSYILNNSADPTGIAIIDEIDLHLHPALEQEVLNCFVKTFPNMQFIVSTHSASVVSNLDASGGRNVIYVMHDKDELPTRLPNLFGIDYNSALNDFMDTPSRNQRLQLLINEYLNFYKYHWNQEAESTYSKILELVGNSDSPALKEMNEKIRKMREDEGNR